MAGSFPCCYVNEGRKLSAFHVYGKDVAQPHGVNAFPTIFVIDKEGKIIYSGTGYDESIETKFEEVITNAR